MLKDLFTMFILYPPFLFLTFLLYNALTGQQKGPNIALGNPHRVKGKLKDYNYIGFNWGKRELITVFRRARAARFSHEWYNWDGVRRFSFGIASPTAHRWWAFHCSIWIKL